MNWNLARRAVLGGFAAIVILSGGGAASAAVAPDAAAKADAVFASLKPDGPAVSALFMKDGKVVYQKAFGQADIEHGVAATTDTRFHVASTSKQFATLAVLMLAEDGKVDLNADVRGYLPWVPDFGKTITVDHLIHHTSGLRDQWSLFMLGGQSIEGLLTQEAVVEMVRRQEALNFAPGDEFSYSNTGYTLLAEIVKSVSGQTLRQFIDARLFRPLGMTKTFFYDNPHEMVPDRAVSYSIGAEGPELNRLNYATWGATSLITTPGDLRLWANELLHPKVLSPALVKTFTTRGMLNDGATLEYAGGIMHNTVAGHRALGHAGADAGFRSSFYVFPDDDAAVIVQVSGAFNAEKYAAELAGAFFGVDKPVVGQAQPINAAPTEAQMQRLAGYYTTNQGAGVEFAIREGKLVLLNEGAPPTPLDLTTDGSVLLGFRLYRARYGADGKVVDLRYAMAGEHPTVYTPAKRAPATAADLAAVAGSYRSDELDVTYRLAVCGGNLTASNWRQPKPVKLTPSVKDSFDSTAGRWTVVRDAGGKPTALRLDAGRVLGVTFTRTNEDAGRPVDCS